MVNEWLFYLFLLECHSFVKMCRKVKSIVISSADFENLFHDEPWWIVLMVQAHSERWMVDWSQRLLKNKIKTINMFFV